MKVDYCSFIFLSITLPGLCLVYTLSRRLSGLAECVIKARRERERERERERNRTGPWVYILPRNPYIT